jgi:hypothetical protein
MSAALSLANALLRSAGGRTVLLHLPAPAVPSDTGEQLGLATPLFQDAPLTPVVLRKLRPRSGTADKPRELAYELLVSASAVKKIVDSLAFDAAEVLFAQASGVLIDGTLLGITSVASDEAFGTVYLYRLGLRGAVKDLL